MRLQGRYELQEKIGEGGMARVYYGWDSHIGQGVAIKVLKHKEKEAVEAFLKEAALLRRLRHPGIPLLYDVLQEAGCWYLVMEYLEGITLEQYLTEHGAMPQEQALQGIRQLLQCLSCLHGENPPVIYGDMKPANILLSPEGTWKLLDFGAACEKGYDRRRQEKRAGTYGFAAPEQTGQTTGYHGVDERSDIYAVGKTWYYVLTGQNPAYPPYGTIPARCYVPDLAARTEQALQKATCLLPEDRYQTVCEMEQALEGAQKSGTRRGKSAFIRKIEKQLWLAETKQEYTFYQDSCIMKNS